MSASLLTSLEVAQSALNDCMAAERLSEAQRAYYEADQTHQAIEWHIDSGTPVQDDHDKRNEANDALAVAQTRLAHAQRVAAERGVSIEYQTQELGGNRHWYSHGYRGPDLLGALASLADLKNHYGPYGRTFRLIKRVTREELVST